MDLTYHRVNYNKDYKLYTINEWIRLNIKESYKIGVRWNLEFWVEFSDSKEAMLFALKFG